MPYWGSGSADNDYAFGAVGMYALMIKERMFQDAQTVIEKSHPEQGIIASMECLRLLAKHFRKCVKVHFRRKDLERAKELFALWYGSVEGRLPKDHRESIKADATKEFDLFEFEVFTPALPIEQP